MRGRKRGGRERRGRGATLKLLDRDGRDLQTLKVSETSWTTSRASSPQRAASPECTVSPAGMPPVLSSTRGCFGCLVGRMGSDACLLRPLSMDGGSVCLLPTLASGKYKSNSTRSHHQVAFQFAFPRHIAFMIFSPKRVS